MGCDIHLVLEQRDPEFGWVAIDTFTGHESRWTKGYSSPIARERDYLRFAALAGVRGDGPAPRGVPEDASQTTRFLVKDWGPDGHSHSWLPLKEAVQAWNAQRHPAEKSLDPESFQAKFPAAYWFGIDSEGGEDSYRVVFWFDN